jgi:hypothetical protein
LKLNRRRSLLELGWESAEKAFNDLFNLLKTNYLAILKGSYQKNYKSVTN